MHEKKLLQLNRFVAGFMSFMTVFLVLLSFFFIASEVGHECHGEDCCICECIEQCCNLVRRMGEGTVGAITTVFILSVVVMMIRAFERKFSKETLVSAKVRLND